MALWNDVGTRYIQETITPGEGVDTFRSPLQLSSGQASDMLDFSSRQYPSLRTRTGRDQLYAPFLSSRCYQIFITKAGAVHAIIDDATAGVSSSSKWVVWNTTAWTWDTVYSIGGTNTYSTFEEFDGVVYIIQSDAMADRRLRYCSAGLVVGNVDSVVLAVREGPVCAHINRLFCMTGDANGNLAYSKIFDATTWTSPDGGIIPVGMNDTITALHSMPNKLFIGTNNGIYALFGEDEDNFVLTTISKTLSVSSSCVFNGVVYFTNGFDVYEYNGTTIRNITRYVNGNGIRGGFAESDATQYTYRSNATANAMVSDGRRLYVTTKFTNTDGTYKMWVFDILRRCWHIESIPDYLAAFTVGLDNKVVMAVGRNLVVGTPPASKVYRFESVNAYDSLNQYNLVTDANMTNIAEFTAVAGVDAIVGGFYQVTGNGTQAYVGTYQNTPQLCVSGDIVYATVQVRVRDAVCTQIAYSITGSTGGTKAVESILTPAIDTWYTLNNIITLDGTTTGLVRPIIVASYADAATANNKLLECRYMWADDTSLTYGDGREPTVAAYEADMLSVPFTSRVNTIDTTRYPSFVYVSPAFQVRPSAKKTLANLWISADLSSAATFYVQTSSDLDSTSFTTIYTMGTAPTKSNVTKIKVPIGTNPKSEWIRVKIYGTGQAKILNIAQDWRVVERTR